MPRVIEIKTRANAGTMQCNKPETFVRKVKSGTFIDNTFLATQSEATSHG